MLAVLGLIVIGGIAGAVGDEDPELTAGAAPIQDEGDPDGASPADPGSTADSPTSTPTTGPTNTPIPTPTPAPPTATPTPAVFSFGGGKQIVGADIPAGTYRTPSGSDSCYWERLSGFGGTLAEILANENPDGPAIVTIAETDKGFNSSRCERWSADLSPITSDPSGTFGDGTYFVGIDIAPGTWRSANGSSCYWARLSGFSGELGDILANDNEEGSAIVEILPGDDGFTSSRCGTWSKIG
ncbi:MAG TPA: hypothetical protein VGE01_07950 [Fimbriimonas sp.]